MATTASRRRPRSAPARGADGIAAAPAPEPPVEPVADPAPKATLAEGTHRQKTPRRTGKRPTAAEGTPAASSKSTQHRPSGKPRATRTKATETAAETIWTLAELRETALGTTGTAAILEQPVANADRAHPSPARLRSRTFAYWIGGLVALVGGLFLAVTVLATPPDRVAVASPDRTSVAAAPWRSVEETFDELPMDSKPPKPWSVTGDGHAAIVALPTSVDRSLRISSTLDGGATSACRPTAIVLGGTVRIAFDYLVGRPPPSPTVMVTIESATARQLAFAVDQAGAASAVAPDEAMIGPTESGGRSSVPARPAANEAAAWQRLEITIDLATGVVLWQAHDSSGAETGSGETRIPDPTSGAFDRMCFLSPQGLPSGWLAIDDVVVEG